MLTAPHFFLCCLLACSLGTARGQQTTNCLDWKSHVTVNTFLLQKMHAQYDQRRQEFAEAISSGTQAQAYVRRVRERCRLIFGALPVRTPLHAVVTGTLQEEGFRIEKIVYESFPRHHVTANLYLPQGSGKFPAALLFCGHENEAKATPSYQQTASLFAREGFVVLVIDPVSQGERMQLTGPDGLPLTRGGTTEHTLLNECSNLVGTSTPADELWDNIRGLDYLTTRKEVDTSRIGCLGNSGGGMQTIYFAGLDPRVKIFAPCSYLSSRERTLELSGPADGCAQVPGEGKEHLELNDFLIAAAPKPVLILAGRYDFIDYTGTVRAFREMKAIYAALRQPQRVALFTCDDGHGISKPKREAAVRWFKKWFYHEPGAVHEKASAILGTRQLQCTQSGQVATSFAGECSILQRDLARADTLTAERTKFMRQDPATIRRRVATLLSIPVTPMAVQVEYRGMADRAGSRFQKLILRKPGNIPLPVLQLQDTVPREDTVSIWVDAKGKALLADSSTLMHFEAVHHHAVFLCDLSGTGETADEPAFNDKKYDNDEYRNAVLALHIGTSMVAVRTSDILTLVDYIRSLPQYNHLPVILNATGITTIPALHAALFRPDIYRVNLFGGLTSYRTILNNAVQKNWYSDVINGVLQYYDLPDLRKMLGKEKVREYSDLVSQGSKL